MIIRPSIVILLFLVFVSFSVQGQFRFRLILTDKGETGSLVHTPEKFLSQKAIARRYSQDIPVDNSDLPVYDSYLSQLKKVGATPIVVSRWLNSVVVEVSDSAAVTLLNRFPFVKSSQLVWRKENNNLYSLFASLSKTVLNRTKSSSSSRYGDSYDQLARHCIPQLHQCGYRGTGMQVAVIDGGFCNANKNAYITAGTILGVRDFTGDELSPLVGSSHGADVFSVMAANKENKYVGSAPDAQYWLLRTEVDLTEFPIEEDYWVAAAEFADSVGVDIITSSLGYSQFDDSTLDYTIEQLDGTTSFISCAAQMATTKGMIVVCSAGNEKDKDWGKIVFPGDVPGVLTIGALDSENNSAPFSGVGVIAEKRVKPDLMALGVGVSIVNVDGKRTAADGSSFSTPIMAGALACLWQSLPHYNAKDIVSLVRSCASRYQTPDVENGYGVANVCEAMLVGQSRLVREPGVSRFEYRKTPLGGYLLSTQNGMNQDTWVVVYDFMGSIVYQCSMLSENWAMRLPYMPEGIYFAVLCGMNGKRSIIFDHKIR